MQLMWTAAVLATARAVVVQSREADDMGPVGFLWPEDRPWSAESDNIPPCGSSAGVGERTSFPLTNGRLALLAQEDNSAVHVGVSYSDNPTSVGDFDIFYGPQQVGDLDIGHTCIWAPNPPDNVTAGSNATFMFFYQAEGNDGASGEQIFWACTDVTYVETAAFNERVPCFNATESSDGEASVDNAVPVTTTLPDGSDPHPEFNRDGGLSGGAIAGAVIGSLAGAAVLIAGAIFMWRRSKKSKAATQEPSMQQVEKAMSDTSSH